MPYSELIINGVCGGLLCGHDELLGRGLRAPSSTTLKPASAERPAK